MTTPGPWLDRSPRRALAAARPRSTLALLAALAGAASRFGPPRSGPTISIRPSMRPRPGRPSLNLDSWAMRADHSRGASRGGASGADLVLVEGAWACSTAFRRPAAADGSTADLAALRLAGRCSWSTSPARRNRPRRWCDGFASTTPTVAASRASCSIASPASGHRELWSARDRARSASGARRYPARRALSAARAPSRPGAGQRAWRSRGAARRLADLVERASRSRRASASSHAACRLRRSPARAATPPPPGQRIALARDEAFTFIYPHLLEGWRRPGAEIVPFSPLADEAAGGVPTSAGCPAAIPSCMPAGSPRRALPRRPRQASPRRGRCMASAAATWCWARALDDADGVQPRMAGLLRPCHELRQAHAASRLSRRATLASDCLPWAARDPPARARVPLFQRHGRSAATNPSPMARWRQVPSPRRQAAGGATSAAPSST